VKTAKRCSHRLLAFGKMAETINKYCQKGKPILVEGRLKYETWDDKESGASAASTRSSSMASNSSAAATAPRRRSGVAAAKKRNNAPAPLPAPSNPSNPDPPQPPAPEPPPSVTNNTQRGRHPVLKNKSVCTCAPSVAKKKEF